MGLNSFVVLLFSGKIIKRFKVNKEDLQNGINSWKITLLFVSLILELEIQWSIEIPHQVFHVENNSSRYGNMKIMWENNTR
jgi:hypothetical protein